MVLKVLFNNRMLDTVVSNETKKYYDISTAGINKKAIQIFEKHYANSWKGALFEKSIIRAIKSSVKKYARVKKAIAIAGFISTEDCAYKIREINNIKKKFNKIQNKKYSPSLIGREELSKDLKLLVEHIKSIDEKCSNFINNVLNPTHTLLMNKEYYSYTPPENPNERSEYDNANGYEKTLINQAKQTVKQCENYFTSKHNFTDTLTENEIKYIQDNNTSIVYFFKLLSWNKQNPNEPYKALSKNTINKQEFHKFEVAKRAIKETGIGAVEDNLHLGTHRVNYIKNRSSDQEPSLDIGTLLDQQSNDTKDHDPKGKEPDHKIIPATNNSIPPNYDIGKVDHNEYSDGVDQRTLEDGHFLSNVTYKIINFIGETFPKKPDNKNSKHILSPDQSQRVADLKARFSEKATPFLRGTMEVEVPNGIFYSRVDFKGHFIYSTLKSLFELKKLALPQGTDFTLDYMKKALKSSASTPGFDTHFEFLIGKSLTKNEKAILKEFVRTFRENNLIDDIHEYLKIKGKSHIYNPLISLIGKIFPNKNINSEETNYGFSSIHSWLDNYSADSEAEEDNLLLDSRSLSTKKVTRKGQIKKSKQQKVADLEKKFSEETASFFREELKVEWTKGIFYSNLTFKGDFIYNTLDSLLKSPRLDLDENNLTLDDIKSLLKTENTQLGTKIKPFNSNVGYPKALGTKFEYVIGKSLSKEEKETLEEFIRIFENNNLIDDIHEYLKTEKSSNPLINLIGKKILRNNEPYNNELYIRPPRTLPNQQSVPNTQPEHDPDKLFSVSEKPSFKPYGNPNLETYGMSSLPLLPEIPQLPAIPYSKKVNITRRSTSRFRYRENRNKIKKIQISTTQKTSKVNDTKSSKFPSRAVSPPTDKRRFDDINVVSQHPTQPPVTENGTAKPAITIKIPTTSQ